MVMPADAARARLSRSYPALAESVPCARTAVTGLAADAGADDERLEAIRLAVSEAFTNAVRHAYPDGRGLVHVTAVVAEGMLTLLIADDGCGLRRSSRTPGLGWGLALISDASDSFTLTERADGGTEARISFQLGAPMAQPEELRSSATTPAASRFSTTR